MKYMEAMLTKVKNKHTGAEKYADYLRNRLGNLRYNIDGRFLTDKEFDRDWTIVK